MNENFDNVVKSLEESKKDAYEKQQKDLERKLYLNSIKAVENAVVQAINILMQNVLSKELSVSVTNQLDKISTPDAITGAEAIKKSIKELESSLKPKDLDYTPILTHLQAISDALGKLPTKYPTIPQMPSEMAINNLDEVITELKNLSAKVTSLELAPQITVKPTAVKVDAPVVNVNIDKELKALEKAIKELKPVNNSSQATELHNQLVNQMQAVEKAIKDIVFPVPNNKPTYQDSTGKGTSVQLYPNGSVPVSVTTPIDVETKTSQTDVFNQLIIGTRNNQLEIDFSGTDPDTITLLTVTKTNGGDATNGGGQATFSTGTNTSGEIKAVTNRTVTYHPHAENYAAFTAIFSAGLANSFQRIGLYSDTNGFFIGYEGTSFGVTKRSNSVDTTTAQASFNVDTLTGQSGSKYTRNGTPEALDTTKDNLYRIRYGWLGAAPIYWEVLSPDGEWVTFHIIRHPNTAAVPTIEEPNQPLRVHIKKTTAGATNLTIKTACWAAGTSSDLQKITSTLYDETLAKTVRAVITGKTTAGGGGYVNVKVNPSGALATETTLTTPTYKTLIDDTTTASVTYLGKADIGSATSSAVWRISKIDESGSVTSITWSGADFNAIWDNRTSISYS